jgi:hypothetical protein
MTFPPKLLESFKSPDFDIEFFVEEARKSNRTDHVVTQLNQALEFVETELRQTVKEASELIISVANTTDSTIGELLTIREHFSPIKDAFEALNVSEQANLERIKQTHSNLKKAMDASAFVKRISRIITEVAKLRAQYPDLNKERPSESLLAEVARIDELRQLRGIEFMKDDLKWLESAYGLNADASKKSGISPPKPRK